MDCISQTTNCPETAEILAKIEELEIQKKKFIKAIKSILNLHRSLYS